MHIILRPFYLFLLAWTRLDLQIANSAPVRNSAHILRLRQDEDEYERALLRLDLRLDR